MQLRPETKQLKIYASIVNSIGENHSQPKKQPQQNVSRTRYSSNIERRDFNVSTTLNRRKTVWGTAISTLKSNPSVEPIRLAVGNLSSNTTKDDLQEFLQSIGGNVIQCSKWLMKNDFPVITSMSGLNLLNGQTG